jgi:integrase
VNRRLWVAIAVGLGARRSEVESLDWAGIDLDAGILANHGTKTRGSDRATPIPVELLVELRKIPEASRVGRVVGAWPNVHPRSPGGEHPGIHAGVLGCLERGIQV